MGLNFLANLGFYLPELSIIITLCTVLFLEVFYKPEETSRLLTFIITTIGLLTSLIALMISFSHAPTAIFSGALTIDPFSSFIKVIMVLGTLGVLYLSFFSKEIYSDHKTEFMVMTLGILVGGMLLVSANNLLALYLGVETLSILSYVLSAIKRYDGKSVEAGLKYALYGGVTSGIMLFGLSYIYGILGTLQFSEITPLLKTIFTQNNLQPYVLLVCFLFFFTGLGFKIACVPFHMWSPDVYQGAPAPVASFFAIVPKMAGLAAIMRVTHVFFAHQDIFQISWIGLLQVIAALTMTVGNVSAIGQTSMKRLLAYSSIGHSGMMLLTVLSLGIDGAQALLFYGFTYLFMTIGAFFIVSIVSDKMGDDSSNYFKGLIYKHPLIAILMTIILFSLAGLPPFSGFVAKFNIFALLIKKQYYTLAFVAGINSVIALFYYTKVVKYMIFDKEEFSGPIGGFHFQNQLFALIVTAPVLFLGFFWEGLMLVAQGAKLVLL